mmetsp:Transcript_7665/g.14250  ORF Transcript_7665/g.14250 Transcript_7665/m.14250 type:complete len:243 (-) Transcript_7665:161-889(-)
MHIYTLRAKHEVQARHQQTIALGLVANLAPRLTLQAFHLSFQLVVFRLKLTNVILYTFHVFLEGTARILFFPKPILKARAFVCKRRVLKVHLFKGRLKNFCVVLFSIALDSCLCEHHYRVHDVLYGRNIEVVHQLILNNVHVLCNFCNLPFVFPIFSRPVYTLWPPCPFAWFSVLLCDFCYGFRDFPHEILHPFAWFVLLLSIRLPCRNFPFLVINCVQCFILTQARHPVFAALLFSSAGIV